MNVLVIDDNASFAERFSATIAEKYHHQCSVATSGESGLALWESGQFDVVVVDLWMLGKDGLDVIREARVKGHCEGVIVLTCLVPTDIDKRISGLDVWSIVDKSELDMPKFMEALKGAAEYATLMKANKACT